MNKIIAVLIICLLNIASIVFAEAGTTIRFHHDMAIDSAIHEGAVEFQKKISSLSNGKMEVKIYPANGLGDDDYAAELIQIGAIQAAVIPTSKLANFSAKLKVLDYPYLFNSKAQAYDILDGDIGNELMTDLPNRGITGLGFWESGNKIITCNNVFQRRSSMKNVSVRVMQSSILIEQYRALGAIPIVTPFSETYVALQHGLVSCQENPIMSIAKMKFYEVQNELLISNHNYLGYTFIVSKRWFNSLSESQRKLITSAEAHARTRQRIISSQLENTHLQEILAYPNMQEISPSYADEIKEAFLSVTPQKNTELYDTFNRIRESTNES